MSAKGLLGAMVVGTVVVMVVGARRSEPARQRPVVHHAPEAPWLSSDAAAQLIGTGGNLGPLFHGVRFGLPVLPEDRARIAAFAQANHVAIDLEMADGDLAAIRLDVTYGGCCGYEGADVLALRLGRRSTGVCCVCGPDTWIDNWISTFDDGVHMTAHVRVNRVTARWERTMTPDELLERADRLLGMDPAKVAAAEGDRWIELAPHRYMLELPMPFERAWPEGYEPTTSRDALGVYAGVHAGRIEEVSFVQLDHDDDGTTTALQAAMRARWGRPRITDDTWTWRRRDRVVTAEGGQRVTISAL